MIASESSTTATSSITTNLRRAALMYLLMGLAAPFHLMYMTRRFIVPGDAAATAANIVADERLYRLGVFAGLVSSIAFLLLAVTLYELFRDVDRRQARLMVALVIAAVSIGLANVVTEIAPLVILSDGDFLSTFTRGQVESLSFAFLRLRNAGLNVAAVFWGLWLFPFGLLVIRSRFIPKVLGYFLFAAGAAYVVFSVTALVFPEYRPIVSRFALPFYLGELPMMIWLLVNALKGSLRRATA